ncbi:Nesprin-1 [Orchesella cincta]|uniref:Nesprin-1 n=1 Tax=Orchesella cincta TaxID=48709 RepID=A0A1D2N7R3_ORCCI|nr:Nesprin-1 [Orchesella cincta]
MVDHVPPMHIVDLIEDLKDGTRLLALLEVLSGDKLPVEKGRNLRRPHFLSNCNTALQFLQSKKVKVQYIYETLIVRGIEENTKVLASLGYRYGSTPTPVDGGEGGRLGGESPGTVTKHGRVTPSDRWKEGARKALLNWVQGLLSKKFGLQVNDFGNSWRDGYAFLAIVNCIKPGLVDIENLRQASNRTRLETAFRVAEADLGIARLLDPEDVDVPRPDEKSIMTYVAQFLHKSNQPRIQADSFSVIQATYDELLTWLMQKTQYMEHMKQTNALSMVYSDYVAVVNERNLKIEPYQRLKTIVESQSMVGITDEAWSHLDSLWKKLESQLKEWQWRLDARLPDPFGRIGQWLAKAELLVSTNDVPPVMDDEAARILNTKIEDHKAFFSELPSVQAEFKAALSSHVVHEIPSEQLESMANRLNAMGPLASQRAVKLKFLEHKCCLVAFIVLVENRLKQWTVKYGREEHVKSLLDQYNNFVNRNKIFQEFQRAYIDMQHVIDEYKREGGIDAREGRVADHFLWEIGERWKSVSMELRCLQSMLEEVIAYWRRIDNSFLEWLKLNYDDFLQDVAVWHEKYQLLNDTVSFLVATCDTPVTTELKEDFAKLSMKWESLFQHVKQYQHAGQMLRMRKDFLMTLSGLQKWLRNAEDLLAAPQPVNVEAARMYNKQLQTVMLEIDDMDEQWRLASKKFQSLLPELSGEDVDKLMKTIKKEKECLVRVRAQLPQRQAQVHSILTQQESLFAGQQEITDWLQAAENMMNNYTLTGGPQASQSILDKHRQFFAKSLYYKTMLESKNKIVVGIVKSATVQERPQVEAMAQNTHQLNERFKRTESDAQMWEHKLTDIIRCWRNYDENKQVVTDWMTTAEKLLLERNLEAKQTVEAHKNYFEQINDRPLREMVQASHDLKNCVAPEEYEGIQKTVEQIQSKWQKIMSVAPLHVVKLEFRLEEEALASVLKEIDKEIAYEHQLLNKKEDPQTVLFRYVDFFEHGKLPSEARVHLEKLCQMESRFSVQYPNDKSLKDQLEQAKAASNVVNDRVKNLRLMLEEIPQQWNAYRTKFDEVVQWMNSVDAALQNIAFEVGDPKEFELEKAKFVAICRDVDRRREDMKKLVQMLDSLVSRRADEEALKEQDSLEQLITRYKNMVPTIEITMVKTEVHSRCYAYRDEAQRVCLALNRVNDISAGEVNPDSLEEVERLIIQHQAVLKQLEAQRATMVSLLHKGRDLQKDQNAPQFIHAQVNELDRVWNETYNQANDRLKKLKESQKIWVEYRSQREDILHLLQQAESELKKLVPKHDPKKLAADLRTKQDMSVALREATEDMLNRLKNLSQSLSSVSSPAQRPVLEKEVEEIERRMRHMLDLMEEKVQHLGQYNEKWSSLAGQIDDMKNWMKNAQKALQQLLSSDLPPEERLLKAQQLQDEIAQRMKLLEQLEKDAQDLLTGEVPEEEVEGHVILKHVDGLKAELVNLHERVAVQSQETAQSLQTWQQCKAELDEVQPWLEKTELIVNMGWNRPTTLKEAQANAIKINELASEVKAQQAKISVISERGGKPGKGASQDDIETTLSKMAQIGATVVGWKEKSDNLMKNWTKYGKTHVEFEKWLNVTEAVVQEPVDRKLLTSSQLETILTKLKDLNKEVSEHQSQLIGVTQECDSVVQSLSPEGASALNAELSNLKSRLTGLANELRGKMNYISDAIIARQESDAKVSDLQQFLEEFPLKCKLGEIYRSKLEQAMQQMHTAYLEYSDRASLYTEVKEEAKALQAAKTPMAQRYLDATAKYHSLEANLQSQKGAISQWVQFNNWFTESSDSITHFEKQLAAPNVKKAKIHEVEKNIDFLAEKCDEWQPKADQLDSFCSGCNIVVKDNQTGLPLQASELVFEIKNRLKNLHKNASSLLEETEKVGTQWDKLKAMESDLKNYLKEVQAELQDLRVEQSSYPSLEKLRDDLQSIIEQFAKHESLKTNIHRLANELMITDPNSATTLQGIIKNSDTEWDKVQAELNDNWSNMVEVLDVYSRYTDSKDKVDNMLKDAREQAKGAMKGVAHDSTTAIAALDHLKKCLEILNKKKILVDNANVLNQQLCSLLHSVPNYSGEDVANEMDASKKAYERLHKELAEYIPKVETQLVLWKTIEGAKDEIVKWLGDTYESLEEAKTNFANSDMVRSRMGQYKDELGEKYNKKMSVISKANQLTKMNDGKEIPNLNATIDLIEEGFSEVDILSKELEKCLGSFEDTEQEIRTAMKQASDKVLRLKDTIAKCEDRTGTPQDVLERIKTLSDAARTCKELKPEVNQISARIADLKGEYPSWDCNLISTDMKTMEKRLDICKNQIGTVNAALLSVLEKDFQDKLYGLDRIISGIVEKIKWCDPKGITDNFSFESKLSALAEVESGVTECHEKIPPCQSSLSVLQELENYPKIDELSTQFSKSVNDLHFVESNHDRIKSQLEEFSDSWKAFEQLSEEATTWLKDVEGRIKNESLTQIHLAQLPEKIREADQLAAEVDGYSTKFAKLSQLSKEIQGVAPDARTSQVSAHLSARHEAVKKFISTLKDKLKQLENGSKEYEDSLTKCKQWIDNADGQLAKIDQGLKTGLKPTAASQQNLKVVRDIIDSKEGHQMLNKAVESGEYIVPGVSLDSKENIRQELRNVRDKWESHLDKGNALAKKLEALQLQWSTFDESQAQVQTWFQDAQAKAKRLGELQPTLIEKKKALQERRSLFQDITSHADVVFTLKDKAQEFSDDEMTKSMNDFTKSFESLKKDVQNAVAQSEKHCFEHEKFDSQLESFRDWLSPLQGEINMISTESVAEKDDAEARLATISQILKYEDEGNAQLEQCKDKLTTVLSQTDPKGHETLKRQLESITGNWNAFLDKCKITQEEVQQVCGKIFNLVQNLEELSQWLRQKELQLKDQSFKSTVEAKSAHLTKLQALKTEIGDKAPEFQQLSQDVDAVQNDVELQSRMAQLNSRYTALSQPLSDIISRYMGYVSDHQQFNSRHAEFLKWMDGMKKECKDLSEIVGDMTVLQDRRQKLGKLLERKAEKASESESIIDAGEKLYSHTSPDGREIIRQQIRTLRDGWETIGEQMQSSWQRLDACLSQFEDFKNSQEELTKWLKGIEQSMRLHTQLKATLQEKKAQLQNHKIVNQEISSHQVLVEAVCDKAQQLVDLTQDSSLQIYITSIKQLFQSLKQKSKDLLEKLEGCVADHAKLQEIMNEYNDWQSTLKDRLALLEDTSGEKAEILRRIEEVQNLKLSVPRGSEIIEKMEKLSGTVCGNTAEAGGQAIVNDVNASKNSFRQISKSVEDILEKLNNVLKNWQEFEAGLQKNTQWFRQQEAVFRSQVLQSTLPEKQEAFENFSHQRALMNEYETEINKFMDQSHALLNASSAERIKPLIMQINNRYQLLHVLSKEVVNKWQGIVDDHKSFQAKFGELSEQLDQFEEKFKSVKKETDLDARNARVSTLATEKEQISHKINVLVQLAEKIYPDTAANGREKIRQDLRALRDRFDKFDQEVSELQKKQVNESQQWTGFQENLQQTLAWLAAMEKSAQSEPPNWLSIPDARSKLMKLKATLQDAISHKRIIEGVTEKAQVILQKNLGPNTAEIKQVVDDLNKRYEALLNNMLVSITGTEETLDTMQQWNDVQKKLQDWQKNTWEQLNLCTDYSGGKPALQSRLVRVEELEGTLGEGEGHLENLNTILSRLVEKVSGPAKETLERDATNLKFDFEKLKNGIQEVRHLLQERLQQWSEYEDGFDRLLSWLSEAEGTLKAYTPCNNLEEKEEQLDKYQNLLKNLKEKEAEFDRMGIDGSELVQATGESRIATNVQQITSRFESVQMTAKEILKKCEQAVADHREYRNNHSRFVEWLHEAREDTKALQDISGTRPELEQKLAKLKERISNRQQAMGLLNTVMESGERLYASTGSDGREIIRLQLEELQAAFDAFFDDLSSTEREMNGKLTRWFGFEESKDKLSKWLKDMENALPRDIELKATLDEKRAQLQKYRTTLHDILSHQQDVFELKDKAAHLHEGSESGIEVATALTEKHQELLKKAQAFVEQYEGIVCCHQQYVKAVQDMTEWVDGALNTVNMWSDENQERINLHANLEKLKNLQLSLPEEAYRVEEIRSLGEKVIPGTIENSQENIRTQIDSSQQEWEALLSSVNSSIDQLNNKLSLWQDFEAQKEKCMDWLKEADTKLHAVDLKPNLPSKNEQLNDLKTLQGEVRARELEVDAISELALNLQKQIVATRMSSASSSELTIKYQQVSHKVKELTNKWQGYVSTHQDFDTQIADCSRWLGEIKEKLSYCADLSASSQKDLEVKLGTVHDLLLYKDEGYAKVQKVVETAQSVLANTATAGHPAINEALKKLQDDWSVLAARMVETKNQLDESIHRWAGFLEQIHQLGKTVDYLENLFKDVFHFQTTLQEKRAQLETIRNLEEKIVCEKLEVDSLKSKASEMVASGQQGQAAFQAQEVLKRFDDLSSEVKRLLNEREEQFKDHKAYQECHDELVGWLNRAKEKIPSAGQRTLGDRLYDVETAGSTLSGLMNKKAQGSLLLERLQQSGEVAMASSSSAGKDMIRNEIKALNDSFENLFNDIQKQKDGLETTMLKLRDWKEEYERLSDWLQQCEILIKAAKTTLVATLDDKKKQVGDMHEVIAKLETGNAQIERFNEAATGLLASQLDSYVSTQLRNLNSRYQVQLNMGKDVLKKVEANHDQHQQFLNSLEKTQAWIQQARDLIGECSQSSSDRSKERLQANLAKIQDLVKRQDEGQNLVHATVSWGEKCLRNTRSDGRDTINEQIKDIQAEWDRIVKKLASTKVSLETSLLQWADYNSSYSQVSQWISDREAKLQKVAKPKVSRGKKGHPTPGMSSISIGDRKATLRATNTIVQDIVSLEPMIESVTSKAGNLMQAAPASEISSKYQNLTKQAQEMYAKQKEMVEQHQAFVDQANEFMAWMRSVKERLGKISEPVGDKETLSGKITQLKVLQSEVPEGQKKLETALAKGVQACSVVDDDDRELIEEEVAVLQEEFDNYTESLNKTQQLLEVGLVRWKEWEDQYGEAEEWITKTESEVKSFQQLHNSLTDKKNALEQFQLQLQTIFDWQKELDKLNLKAQLLLETCADSRVSNAVTQMATKFNALLSLAKEVIRRLELHYQEHQQHNALYQECQDWIDRTREKLTHISDINYNLNDVNSRLQSVKGLKQTLEQGQNKLRYALELKEKVMLTSEPSGAAKIHEDTELLKQEFEKLMNDIQETRQRLTARATLLEDLEKTDKIMQDWLQEIELKINVSEANQYVDLSEKRASLEKLKGIEKEVASQADMLAKLEAKISEVPDMPRDPYNSTFVRYEFIKSNLEGHIQRLHGIVHEHENYWQLYNDTADFLRKLRVELQQYSDCHGEKSDTTAKLGKLSELEVNLRKGDEMVKATKEISTRAMQTTSADGKDAIMQQCHQLQFDLEELTALYKDNQKTFKKCLEAWDGFETSYNKANKEITDKERLLKQEPVEYENASPEDLERCKKLTADIGAIKSLVEDLNDNCEVLMEYSQCPRVRDSTVELQTRYSALVVGVQGLHSKIQKSLSDHTDFIKEKNELEAWLARAEGTVQDCKGTGDEASTREKMETLQMVSTRLTEGQHLLNTIQESFARVVSIIPTEQQDMMRDDVTKLQDRWEKLNIDLKNTISDVKDACQRWDDFKDNVSRFSSWCSFTKEALNDIPPSRGELGDMKTLLERYKNFETEISSQKSELEALRAEAQQLSSWAGTPAVTLTVDELDQKWRELDNTVRGLQSQLQEEINEYSDYHNALQETEKWLLQTSFQLMAHNSLYITNREQTLEQLALHDNLLEEIQAYQSTLDDVSSKGHRQISRYINSIPTIENTILKQLKNVQDSYESLLHTGIQIKKRLVESLAKFQEYEDTLESILNNLDELEPEIQEKVQNPVDSIDASSQRLDYIRVVHNRLQGEKNRLSLAVQACEAATASLSRPTSPQEAIMQPIPDKELLVRARLEDLIDQRSEGQAVDPEADEVVRANRVEVLLGQAPTQSAMSRIDDICRRIQTQMTELSSAGLELEEVKANKDAINRWVDEATGKLREIQNRPAKLRADTAQVEMNHLQDIRQGAADRLLQLYEIENQESGLIQGRYLPDLQQKLNDLDNDVSNIISSRLGVHAKITDYRTLVSNTQAWLDGFMSKLEPLEKGSGLPCQTKVEQVADIYKDFDVGASRLDDVKSTAQQIMSSISNVDANMVEEQMKALERRFGEIKKRIQRKQQILETALKSYQDFSNDLDTCQLDVTNKKLAHIGSKIGFEVPPAEAMVSATKTNLKDLESQQAVLGTLDRRLTTLQPELEDSEIRDAEDKLQSVIAAQAELCDEIKKQMAILNDALAMRKRFMDKVENVRLYTSRLSADIAEIHTIPLLSGDVEKKLNMLKKHENAVRDFQDTQLADVKKDAAVLEKDCDEDQARRLKSMITELSQGIDSIFLKAGTQQSVLSDALKNRIDFEEEYSKCHNWLQEAETSVSSDVRGSSNVHVLQEQLTKYNKLQEQAHQLTSQIQSVIEKGKTLVPSLNEPDRQILTDKLSNLTTKMGVLSGNINDKVGSVQAAINDLQQVSNIVEESAKYLNQLKAEISTLNRPVGSIIDDSQGLLSNYEKLLNDLKGYRQKLEGTPLHGIRGNDELRSLMKEQDDLASHIEAQITRLRHLLLLQQQFMSLVTEITSFIVKYTEVVKEIEKSGTTIEEKIKKYDEVIHRIQECEAMLATAVDKGTLIADEGTTADRNAITEQLQSLKMQLQGLRRTVENKKAEHEITAAEHKKYAAELDTAILWLHEKEVMIKSRPLLERGPLTVDMELRRHEDLTQDVTEKLNVIESIEEALKHDDGLPPTLIEKMSEGRVLLKTLPAELTARNQYLTENKDLRQQHENNVDNINKWVKEAKGKLHAREVGVDFENIMAELADHKSYFGNEKAVFQHLHNVKGVVDKIWPSLVAHEQEAMSKDQEDLHELVQNTFNSAKSLQARLEQNVTLYKTYLDLLNVVQGAIAKAELPEEPATTLNALRVNLANVQSAYTNMQNQQVEIDNLNERVKSMEKQANHESRQRLQTQMNAINTKWGECLANLDTRKDALSRLVTQWEQCETLWHEFESGLSAVEEHFSQIDPSIRSQQQLLETKASLTKILNEAKQLGNTHRDLCHYSDFILKHLQVTSDICYSALKSKLEHLSTQYTTVVNLLEDKLQWLTNQGQYLQEIDSKIEEYQALLNGVDTQIRSIDSFDRDYDKVDKKLLELGNRIKAAGSEISSFSTHIKDRFSSLKQVLPTSISKNISNLELEVEKIVSSLDDKQKDVKRARGIVSDFQKDIDAIGKWILNTEDRLQNRGSEPQLVKEALQALLSDLPAVLDQMERAKKASSIIIEKVSDPKERDKVKNSVDSTEAQLLQLKAAIEERRHKIGESLDSWDRFLQLYGQVMTWVEEKNQFLKEPIQLSSLPETRQKLNAYVMAVKSLKTVGKQLSEMGKEIDHVSSVSSASPLHEKLDEAEQAKTDIESQLLERNSLIQETAEEWEQCERKFREAQNWLEKAKQGLENPAGKRKPLRDQLAAREKLIADIHVQRTKIGLALEKLQVHFKAGIGGDPNVAKEESDLQTALEAFGNDVKAQCTALESSVSQIDSLQEEMQQLRSQLMAAEQQLRTVSSPRIFPMSERKPHRSRRL